MTLTFIQATIASQTGQKFYLHYNSNISENI